MLPALVFGLAGEGKATAGAVGQEAAAEAEAEAQEGE